MNFLSGNRPDRGLIPYEPLLIPSLVLGCASLNIAPARVGEEGRGWLLSGWRRARDVKTGNFNAVVVKGDGAGFHDEDAEVLVFWGGKMLVFCNPFWACQVLNAGMGLDRNAVIMRNLLLIEWTPRGNRLSESLQLYNSSGAKCLI